jgi:IS30 family transposase
MKAKRKHLTIEDRMIIQACIHDGRSITQIGTRLGVNKSTISREIHKFTVVKTCSYPDCERRNKLNGLCNACPYKTCSKDKYYYNFNEAEARSKNLRQSSRSKPKISPEKIKIINEIVSEGVHLGQSLHHIYISNKVLSMLCHERTIRKLCYRGNLSIRPHELRRYVTYKHSDIKSLEELKIRAIRVLIGRMYKDFTNYVKHHKRENIVQYDSVIGKISDEQAILTITFPKYNFQFGILIKKSSPVDVRTKVIRLFNKLGNEMVKKILPINLADNGVEFSYFNQIETDQNGEKICRTYFTNPYRSTDKSECERNHEFIRYMIPKGKSLDFLTQEQVDEMFSNINSYVRKSKGDKTPYDLVKNKFGKEFLDVINIHRIPNKKVRLQQII